MVLVLVVLVETVAEGMVIMQPEVQALLAQQILVVAAVVVGGVLEVDWPEVLEL